MRDRCGCRCPGGGHAPDRLGPPPLGPAATFEEEIAAVRASDPEAAREDTARSPACTPGALVSAYGRAWLADPARMVRELADVLERAWRVLVEPDRPRLRALLEADVAFHSRRLAEVGLGRLLPEPDPRLSWNGRGPALALHAEYARDLGGQALVLMPSAFSWPDVVTGLKAPWQPTPVCPARGPGGLGSNRAPAAPRRWYGCWAATAPPSSGRRRNPRPPVPSPTGWASRRPRCRPT
ncbi:DUF5937 family protein [Streptomyces lavenduligriseus]|uniref:DUF5937 family protein n=1 Tax=Streptomyces lavenduligriseus TaxID=67315 RepID=UPI0035590351